MKLQNILLQRGTQFRVPSRVDHIARETLAAFAGLYLSIFQKDKDATIKAPDQLILLYMER